MIKVIDNFLSKEDFCKISDLLLGSRFPWHYNDCVLVKNIQGNKVDPNFQFTHSFRCKQMQKDSVFLPFVFPIGDSLGIKKLYRVKANLTPRTAEHRFTGYHLDGFDCPHTAIYYINSNNGWTDFKNGDKVESVANRVVIFDSKLEHQGVSCTDEKVRLVINFNYE